MCIERGTRCATLDDCLVGELCVDGACAAGKPLQSPCTGGEFCGRDVRCVDGACTYRARTTAPVSQNELPEAGQLRLE